MVPDGFIGAGLALVGKIVFDWLKGKQQRGGNGASGEKGTDYWKLEIRHIVEDIMDRRDSRIKEIVQEAIREELRHK